MKRLLLALMSVAVALAQGPSGAVPSNAAVAMSATGWKYFQADANGKLFALNGGASPQAGPSGYVAPYAVVALGPDGAWHYLQVDSNGNLLVSGSGGAGITACSATPPTSGAAGSVCVGTNGYLYSCAAGGADCTSGQFTVSPGGGVNLQGSAPGTQQTGNINISGMVEADGGISMGVGKPLVLQGATEAAPTVTLPTIYIDSTGGIPYFLNASSVLTAEMIKGIANPSDSNVVAYVDQAGVQHRVTQSAVASTGGANHVQTADGAGGFVDSGCTATGGAETCASGFAGNATTASNLSGTPALPNGTTATTQTAGDATTKLATDAFVTAATWAWGALTGVPSTFAPPAFTGDCTTTSGLTAITCTKSNGTAFGSAAFQNTTAFQAPVTLGATAQYFRGDLSLATFPTTWAWGSLTGVPSTFAPPAFTGDCTTTAGLTAITCTKSSGSAFGSLAFVGYPAAGLVKSSGSGFSAAVAGTDYVAPSGNITGTAANVTGTVAVANGGTGSASALSGLVRGSPSAMTAAELTGDATTSGSNAVTVAKVNGTSVPVNSSADRVLGTTASAMGAWLSVPNCGSGNALQYSTSTHAFSCGSAGISTRTWPFTFQGIQQAGVAGFTANLPAAGAPTPYNAGGTDPMAVLEWPTAQSTYYADWNFKLPSGYTSNANISYSMDTRCNPGTCDSTHAAILTPYWACSSTGAVDAPSWTAVSTVNITNAAAGAITTTAGTIAPTCVATNRAYVKFEIDTNANSLTGPFDLVSVTFSVQGGL